MQNEVHDEGVNPVSGFGDFIFSQLCENNREAGVDDDGHQNGNQDVCDVVLHTILPLFII